MAETLFECATCQDRTRYGCLGCLVCCVPVSLIELLFDIPCTFIEDRCCQGHPYTSDCLQVCYCDEELDGPPSLDAAQHITPPHSAS